MQASEQDGLYEKYRVFKEPEGEGVDSHPIPMTAYYLKARPLDSESPVSDPIGYAEEVMDFVFVLKPSTDHHARVALAAYCLSVAGEKEQLANDLWEILGDLKENSRTYPQ